MDAIEEYPFLFMNTPSSLQMLASTKVALMSWQRRCAASGLSCGDLGRYWFEKPIFSCEEILIVRIPSRIKSQIDNRIDTFGKELMKWKCFHDSVFKYEETYFSKCIKHIVLDFSGTIGYKATALNITNSGEFADVENYRMACLYCLEDQVRRFWPLVSTEDRNDRCYTCNLSYWNGVMESGENSITDGPTKPFIERWMELANRGEDRAAFEQFYQMIPDHEIVKHRNTLYVDEYKCRAAIRSLPVLNRMQVEEVFKGKTCAMFGILAMDDDQRFLQFARQSWNLVRHLILDDESRFSSVLCILWKIAFCLGNFMRTSHTRCDEINELLLEIWSDASDELKASVSDNYIYEFFDQDDGFDRWMCSNCHSHGHNMKFMIDLLNLSRNVDKVRLWESNWGGFALRANVSDFEQLMSSCLANNEHLVEYYKNCVLDLDDFFRKLIGNGFYSDLRDYLYFCSKDAKHFQLLGKKELESNPYAILRHDDDQFAEFEWFVGELFFNKKKDIDKFKAQMISSADSLKGLLKVRIDRRIRSNDFSTRIGRFVTEENEYNLAKRKLLEHCRSYPMNCSRWGDIPFFDEWIEFLEWCIPDPEEHSAFKKSFNVNAIFLKLLRDNATRWSTSAKTFLDKFLRWYFGNEEDSKKFQSGYDYKKLRAN
ncbi:uncharacterized protein LOC135837558 [Planococcus citri]|uniref:uncharacterized protein LOC135837558 n=1 Tax=Planococcus citri TaxID=170843 RepID=UPI0031F816C1